MFLSLIIPAYNEAGRIEPSLDTALRYLRTVPYDVELIVVDDGSKDNTVEVVSNIFKNKPEGMNNVMLRIIPLGQNQGKGAAVRRGMLEAIGEIRIFTDADFSTPIKEIEKVIPLIQSGQYDVIVGSRAVEHRKLVKKHQPWYREAMGRFYNVIVQTAVFRGIKDTQCGFKGFSGKAAQRLFSKQKLTGFSFDVEVLYLARKAGYKMKEIAIEWYNDERSTVDTASSFKALMELLRVRKLHKGTQV